MALQQVEDLRAEGDSLHEFLETLEDHHWEIQTPFKDRTVNWVVQHLHDADRWTVHSVTDPDGFRAWMKDRSLVKDPDVLQGNELLQRWRSYFQDLCAALEAADPDTRAPWFGPDMGIRMMATARQMETWAHGQDIYDLLHVARTNTDRIQNICHIGVRTFGWTFVNRKLEIPNPIPYVRLESPSGAIWEWNEPSEHDYIKGAAVEFAHVVTQGRNIAEADLEVRGPSATAWMGIAQCFAGPPETPPVAGQRGWI